MTKTIPAASPAAAPHKDRPWLIRTYAGHSTAEKSNELYRTNLARGQTGLSDGIPLDKMNTSMTINAPAAWLLSLYIAAGEAQGVARNKLQGTTQNDIIKEYLSRGTYIFPPEPSLRLTADTIGFTYREVPKWNPMNVCSYHLQEAGATPVQELAFALVNAIAVLDAVKARGQVPDADFPQVVGRISFFVNAGIRFITEMCKMRAFAEMWEDITLNRYGVADPKQRLFRYGVQVNSLGLTEQQPENNVYRILLEMLAVVMSKNARARSVQLPAWNEALGLPRPWDQQWSLRLQQIVAFETDLLEYGDIFDGSTEIAAKVEALKQEALAEMARIDDIGGAVAAIESAYMKQRLVESNLKRLAAIESGDQTVVGVNAYTEGAPSPLSGGGQESIMTVDDAVESGQVERLNAWRESRDGAAVKKALADLASAAKEDRNVMPVSIACAQAGVTTGEWTDTLRQVFGEYRAPTGVARAAGVTDGRLEAVRREVDAVSRRLGRRIKILVGKPGLDGHSNGAEQIAVRARDCGMEVVYEGIRLTPERIVNAALEESVHVVGLSILSGGHVSLVGDVLAGLRAAGIGDVPVVVGGIIPPADAEALIASGVARVYTPKDFDLTQIMRDIVTVVDGAWKEAA
ncbi:MAG: protein meaA [Alphaproteobacteria bacterium]|nr:protein meaA [Alphaproteobacteria bacterium]